MPTTTENYSYTIDLQSNGAVMTATHLKEQLKHYVSVVFAVGETPDATVTQICESTETMTPAVLSLNPKTDTIDCPQGYLPLE